MKGMLGLESREQAEEIAAPFPRVLNSDRSHRELLVLVFCKSTVVTSCGSSLVRPATDLQFAQTSRSPSSNKPAYLSYCVTSVHL
jgi:hypothetical protein